jgi:hypothetical protein
MIILLYLRKVQRILFSVPIVNTFILSAAPKPLINYSYLISRKKTIKQLTQGRLIIKALPLPVQIGS